MVGAKSQDEISLRCPTRATLWLRDLRQENAFTQRASYAALPQGCRQCAPQEQRVARGDKGDRARRVSAVRHLLPAPSTVEPQMGLLAATRWVDVACTHCDGNGSIIGVGNMSRSFRSPMPNGLSLHHHTYRVRSVRVTDGVGRIGSHTTPGLVHRRRASP